MEVLLPPGTSSMYEQLLKFEDFELRKKSGPTWDRVLEIRHLKDRMIRKCQKLAKASAAARPPGDLSALSFQTIVAPADFRVKEMEKWFLEQHTRTLAVLKEKRHPSGSRSPCKCIKCVSSAQKGMPPSGPSKPSPSPSSSQQIRSSSSKPEVYLGPKYPSQSTSAPRVERSATVPPRYKSNSGVASIPSRSVTSPPPLPHLLRIRDMDTGYDLSADPQPIISLPTDTPPAQPDDSSTSSEPQPEPAKPVEKESTALKGELRRRPSCIKRTSTADFSKRVSWADNQDLETQVSKYASVAREAQASGAKWEEIRDIYIEQMSGLEGLHQQVEQSLEHLRSESEHLKRANETIALQREMLRSTFQEFERKQLRFQAKGKADAPSC
ncbi:hypothetical protein DXG03_006986 [Asterophora parasitica]|uniref:Uncharacterized protein n=1 Tax=Asterophora parasitica TaxID=117018 RepID=A0A9P7GJ62_9AGAR|nr:hypothetical protein DXG03_006986 [Asterophora parasitica]